MFSQGVLIADRYKLTSLLGKGGFSEVWLAEDVLADIKVAIKIYAPGVGLDDAGISLFTKEFSLVFDMNHTNLLHPTHFDCWQRMPFLILPYCQNGSAFKYVSTETQISEEEAWKVLHDVASGLAYLHGKTPPIIHQDIKPDNILISDEGRYMITDFGISARVRSTLNRSAAEMSGGTLAYMGPERFGQSPQPIMASDVWSLGAMMYELMTGLPPFDNHGGMLQKNGADIPLIEGEYSLELKNLVYRCVALNTWDRPTAEQVARETNEYFMSKGQKEESLEKPVSVNLESAKKDDGTLSKKAYIKWSVIGAILGFVVAAFFIFRGCEQENIQEYYSSDPDPQIYYDSIYNLHKNEGDRLFQKVKRLVDIKEYDSSKSGICLEDTLMEAYDEYSYAILSREESGIEEKYNSAMSSLKGRMLEIDSVLSDILRFCEENRTKLKEKNNEYLNEAIEAFEERIHNIDEFKNDKDVQ